MKNVYHTNTTGSLKSVAGKTSVRHCNIIVFFLKSLEFEMHRFLVVALLLIQASAISAEPQTEAWGQSGDWTIRVNPTVGNGCFAEKDFANGTLIQIGFVPARRGGFLAAYNTAWSDISEGQEDVLRIDFGDALFEGAVIGKVNDGTPGGYAFFDNPKFVDEFRKRNSLILSGRNSGHRIEINLKGTSRALSLVEACQQQQPKS